MSTTVSNQIVEQALEGSLEEMRISVGQALDERANQIMNMMKEEIAHNYFGQSVSEAKGDDDTDDEDDDEVGAKDADKDKGNSKNDDDDDDDKDCDDKDMKKDVKESNIDELSKKTLGSYVKKASYDNARSAIKVGNGSVRGVFDTNFSKRTKDISKAVDKLTKEDTEVNEDALEDTKLHKDYASWSKAAKSKGYSVEKSSGVGTHSKAMSKSGNERGYFNHSKGYGHLQESEEVNELSKKTLGSYVKKAGKHAQHNSMNMGMTFDPKRKPKLDKMFNQSRMIVNKRNAGISKAVDKLTKEDTKVNERDEGKPGKNFSKIEKSAGKEYGSKEAGARVAGAILSKLRAKHPKEYKA